MRGSYSFPIGPERDGGVAMSYRLDRAARCGEDAGRPRVDALIGRRPGMKEISQMHLSRRHMLGGLGAAAGFMALGGAALAAGKTYRIGVTLPLTGADAEPAHLILNGILLAIDQANKAGALPGITLEAMVLNNATTTAGEYDPAQAATNARKLVGDPGVLVNIGPEMSGSGKAMAPILSMGMLATITPSSTSPSITDPAFAAEFDPGGKPIYFRTVTTDAYQGPDMANFYAETLRVPSSYILDDSGAYGVGLADAFEKQAKAKGITVLGRDRLDPRADDYTAVVTKIEASGAASLYFGGGMQAAVKLVKQCHDIVPKIVKGGGDGILSPEMVTAAGFPAAEGWYVTSASPHLAGTPALQKWSDLYTRTYGVQPSDYSVTAYDATLVAIAAIQSVTKAGKPLTAANVRDAIQASKVEGLQGTIVFDRNGDLAQHMVTVFQFAYDPKYRATDFPHQYRYVSVAPQN